MRRGGRIVRDHDLDDTAEIGKRRHMRIQPRWGLHIQKGLAVDETRIRQHCDEQVHLGHNSVGGIDDVEGIANPINEHRSARLVVEDTDEIVAIDVLSEESAELGVSVLLLLTRGICIPSPGL